MERIQKVIANYGYCSRRKAEELLLAGKVKVNGRVVTKLGLKVSAKDKIEVNGIPIKKQEKEYIILNKPRGVITSTNDNKNRTTVTDIVNSDKRIYPVGRLDYETTGLLILTNDGELANLLMHPKNEVPKTYIAKIEGILSKEGIKKLEKGIIIDKFKTSPSKIKVRKINRRKNTSIVEITIHEGRNHQVKKMFLSVGHKVLKLKRERISFLTLQGLNSGEYRHLSNKEVRLLYNEITKK